MAPAAVAGRMLRSSEQYSDIAGLSGSSLELDKRSTDDLTHIFSRDTSSTRLSPIAAHNALIARDDASTYVPGAGSRPAGAFNNKFFFALFAIIGVIMVLGALWFLSLIHI